MTENRIAEARKAKGLSQSALAEALGAHWVTISKLERGRMRLTVEWMNVIAPVLGVKPSDLLALEQPDRPDYQFRFQIVDRTSGEIVWADYTSLTDIDEWGGCESVDRHVAAMLKGFRNQVRAEYERKEYPELEDEEA